MLSKVKSLVSDLLNPLTGLIVKTGVKPNHLTFLGLLVGFFSAYLIASKELLLGGIFILVSGFFDMLDGALARNQILVSEFGGFLDSVFDRYVDVAIFIALGIYGVNWIYITLALSGALLVSYTRARAEKIIEKCDVGIAERGERLIIIFLGILAGYVEIAIIIVAILSHLTAIHRILHTRAALKH
ncbi:MAG: CDP-alcohol phosphatidyltransferase family protein [Archaeoglobus sp.]|nr:CDP-alcohol phosphatidyltransferase family protein [Archaeoglobus sp.]